MTIFKKTLTGWRLYLGVAQLTYSMGELELYCRYFAIGGSMHLYAMEVR